MHRYPTLTTVTAACFALACGGKTEQDECGAGRPRWVRVSPPPPAIDRLFRRDIERGGLYPSATRRTSCRFYSETTD
jgi:hypothetical protein